MATGIGLDPISVAKETRNAYVLIRDAPGEFKNIYNETQTMVYLLSRVIPLADGFEFDKDTAETFVSIFNSCWETAIELREQLSNYRQLQAGARSKLRCWKRARWAVGTTRDAKQQLMMHIIILGIVNDLLETRRQEIRFDNAVQMLRADMQRYHLSLSSKMDGITRLLFNEIKLEQDEWGTHAQMSVVAKPVRSQVLSRIDHSRPSEFVHETIEAAFGDASFLDEDTPTFLPRTTSEDDFYAKPYIASHKRAKTKPRVPSVAQSESNDNMANATQGTWTGGVLTGAALTVSGYAVVAGVRLLIGM